jgi:hypothetical protein
LLQEKKSEVFLCLICIVDVKDEKKRQWLLTIMNALDPKFETQLAKEERQEEEDFLSFDINNDNDSK